MTSVTPSGGSATTFAYDANGIRTKTVQPGGITTYFPFPGYEVESPTSNPTVRITFSIAGQTIATRVSGDPVNNGLTYFYNDHLGSLSALRNPSGGRSASIYYLPFGNYRGAAPTQTVTDRDFTGQPQNRAVGLLYYQARFYVPGIGRFASADTVVPGKENPQAFNRYSYVANNPLLFVDESGHCWGFASGIRNWNFTIGGTTYGGGTNCANIDMALAIVQHPDATPAEKAQAGVYLGGWGLAAASGATGTGLLACSTIATCAKAAEAALGIGAATCRDGDCGNEAEIVARSAQSVWNMNPFQRGIEIENMLGRSPNLSQNFPVIDRFQNGVATSIKSLDLGANSYQNINTLTNKVRSYVNTLANWQGIRWGGVNISASSITGREVLLAVPPGASQAQINALLQLQQWANSVGVTLNVVVVP